MEMTDGFDVILTVCQYVLRNLASMFIVEIFSVNFLRCCCDVSRFVTIVMLFSSKEFGYLLIDHCGN